MTERLQPGQYKVKQLRAPGKHQEGGHVGVVKGEQANSTDSGVFGNQFGFKSSKWYIYTIQVSEVVPHPGPSSPTAPREGRKRTFEQLGIVNQEFDTKSEAVDFAESNVERFIRHGKQP